MALVLTGRARLELIGKMFGFAIAGAVPEVTHFTITYYNFWLYSLSVCPIHLYTYV